MRIQEKRATNLLLKVDPRSTFRNNFLNSQQIFLLRYKLITQCEKPKTSTYDLQRNNVAQQVEGFVSGLLQMALKLLGTRTTPTDYPIYCYGGKRREPICSSCTVITGVVNSQVTLWPLSAVWFCYVSGHLTLLILNSWTEVHWARAVSTITWVIPSVCLRLVSLHFFEVSFTTIFTAILLAVSFYLLAYLYINL